MEERLVDAVETAIAKLVADFQSHSDRFWNERDMHWGLFYHPKEEAAIQETHVTELVRTEFPTVGKFNEDNPARGRYDLVALDPGPYRAKAVQSMKA